MGHAIGIVGHSQDAEDIMFASATKNTYSAKDIATIKAMYATNEINAETKKQIAINKQ